MSAPPPPVPVLDTPISTARPLPVGVRVTALVVGLVASLLLPGNRLGLGFVLVFLVVAGTVLSARPRPISLDAVLFGCSSVALVSMVAVRTAVWVLAVDLLFAAAAISFAVVGGESWAELARGSVRVLDRLLRAPSALLQPLARRWRGRQRGRLAPAMRGLAIGLALVIVFGILFGTADRAFAYLAGRVLMPSVSISLLPIQAFAFLAVALGTLALASAGERYSVDRNGDERSAVLTAAVIPTGRLGRTEWLIALGLLDALFLAFVLVQVAVLFGGRDHVLDTTGLTYAQYARQGFFQLVAVGVLTLAVVAGAVRWADRETHRDRRLLKVLLGALCGLTLIVLLSALKRLSIYEREFGLTRLRVSVHATILWMGAVFLLVLVAGIAMRAKWLPRAVFALTALSLLVFTLADPDALIARTDVQRFERTGKIDVVYLSWLSADAVPALAQLPEPERSCAVGPILSRIEGTDSWTGSNLARREARTVSEGLALAPRSPCGGEEQTE